MFISKEVSEKMEKLTRVNYESRKVYSACFEQDGVHVPDGMRNPVKISNGVATLYVYSKGKLYEVLVDELSLPIVSNEKAWCIAHKSNPKDKKIYVKCAGNISLHRIITNCPDGMYVDHINGDTLDNRVCNLRIVNHGQNMLNKKDYKNNRTGMKNIIIVDGKYKFACQRMFYSKDIAEIVSREVTAMLDKYSNIDISKRKST